MLWMPEPGRSGSNEIDRKRFIADPDVLARLDFTLDDLADPDVRSIVVQHEHPEFETPLRDGTSEIEMGGSTINPRLHLVVHEIVANQLWDDAPPEVWHTAVRLLGMGYDRHEVLHMLGRTVSNQVWAAWHDGEPYDPARHIAELRALPGSWEEERPRLSTERRGAPARSRARKTVRRSSRRKRPHK
jgi:Domain of unknown function (DUF1841)